MVKKAKILQHLINHGKNSLSAVTEKKEFNLSKMVNLSENLKANFEKEIEKEIASTEW